MSRSKVVLPLVARRELMAVRVAADVRYSKLAAGFDWPMGVLVQLRRKAPVAAAPRAATPKAPKAHKTSVSQVGDKFLATCSCGDKIMTRPTGEPYAKGMATKHVNAVSVVVDAA